MFQKSPARSRFFLELIALGYLIYLIYGLVGDYMSGEAGVPLSTFLLLVIGMSLACVVLAILAFRNWRKASAAEKAEAAEAEAEEAPTVVADMPSSPDEETPAENEPES